MFRLITVSSLSLTASLLACEPVSPIFEGGPAPEDGIWEMKITQVSAKGHCGMAEVAELQGLLFTMDVDPKGEHGIRFDIEGLSLKGYEDGGFMHAEGRITRDSAVGVVVDDVTEPGEPEVGEDDDSIPVQEGHRTESVDIDRDEGDGMHAELSATTRTSSWMSGELLLDYNGSDMDCVIVLEFEASHEGDYSRPPVSEPDPHPESEERDKEDKPVVSDAQ